MNPRIILFMHTHNTFSSRTVEGRTEAVLLSILSALVLVDTHDIQLGVLAKYNESVRNITCIWISLISKSN